jgi:hypothetical protein
MPGGSALTVAQSLAQWVAQCRKNRRRSEGRSVGLVHPKGVEPATSSHSRVSGALLLPPVSTAFSGEEARSVRC